MAVKQLNPGRWICYFRKGTVPEDPERTRYYFRGPTAEADARKKDSEILAAAKARRRVRRRTTPGFTIESLAKTYMEAKLATIARTTHDNLWYKLIGVILPELGHIQVPTLTPEHLDRYVNRRLDKVKRTTIHRELTDIMAILNWAARRRLITVNPVANYQKPRRDDEQIPPATAAEARAIIANAAPHMQRCLLLAYYLGIRPGQSELLNLRYNQIDWDLAAITIFSADKGGPKTRRIPIHPLLMDLLRCWRAADGHDGRIITYKGQPLQRIKRAYSAAKRRAGITRRLPPYAFRHAFATEVIRRTGDIRSAGEMLGHSRIDTTTGIYQYTDMDDHRRAINTLPDLFDRTLKNTPGHTPDGNTKNVLPDSVNNLKN